MYKYAAAALLLLPSLVLGAEVTVSQNATIGGEQVPVEATVSTEDGEVVLSSTKQEGAVPVVITVYASPKPKPKPAATSSLAAATIESSKNIQNSIASVSPQAGDVVAPFFTLVDGGRQSAADAIDTQIASTKERLGPSEGAVLGEETKNASSDPMGAFWYVLNTLWLYILTILLWLVSNAWAFYPFLALAFFYTLWRVIHRARAR